MPIPQRSTSASDTWFTPPHIFQPLGKFDLDPAAPIENRDWIGATRTFTELEDGLAQSWEGRVWLNPPYGRGIDRWMRKMAEHVKNGGAGIAFIFARTDTKYWQQYVFPVASGILWLEGRVKFCDPTGRPGKYPAPAPSALIAYTPSDLEILAEACETGKIKGNLTIHNITCTFTITESPLKPLLR